MRAKLDATLNQDLMSLLKKQEKADPMGVKNGPEEGFQEEAKKSYYAFKN